MARLMNRTPTYMSLVDFYMNPSSWKGFPEGISRDCIRLNFNCIIKQFYLL